MNKPAQIEYFGLSIAREYWFRITVHFIDCLYTLFGFFEFFLGVYCFLSVSLSNLLFLLFLCMCIFLFHGLQVLAEKCFLCLFMLFVYGVCEVIWYIF
jgi:hypothetical protein